ncbi:3-methyl-2-oxobutanoate hydroxymethyltransferase [Caldimicrobium thiodismutans]|uniref:3-methyl-2-oxobutanoate hydroxymethyltransferase n=1 Tax=Caldimicrobium thiodismutans TaxID=1653476 RepID=A0A0U5B738_9BACT|nr:3-methyl-2-oxobutanoate hydroxymethyltransferase [Caldimicrobium thiodismutans]BAU23888.1 3-methyl-2-oxobutanoate hydroxymethyltransferase [Caldimicrobium thiodismutans]
MSLFKLSPLEITLKKGKEKIAGITAYDYNMARLAESAGLDFILIGDSASMVVLGHPDTYPITLEEMLIFCQAVSRGAPNTLRIGDMPFLSYQVSIESALLNAGRFIKEGRCHAVKVEGGIEVVEIVSALVKAGIPVLAHIGVTPQRSLDIGGLKARGKDLETAKELLDSALALESAGAFAIVLECVPAEISRLITQRLKIPTIGIGAGPYTDGQILVFHDVVGLFPEMRPKFVKNYIDGFKIFEEALKTYQKEVKEGLFPEEKHSFKVDPQILEALSRDD